VANEDISAALEFHRRTSHTPTSVAADDRPLDWANLPRPYKLYPTLTPISLPAHRLETGRPALEAITSDGALHSTNRVPTVAELAAILRLSAGVTKRLPGPNGVKEFRAAPCTGALYHIELYIVCGDLPGLDAGVYHYSPHDDSLHRLRDGDFRGALAEACADQEWVRRAPASIVCTSTYWRNAWKYHERAYRHAFWDSGTILAQLLVLATAHHLPAGVVGGFVDRSVNRLLDLDAQREVAVAVASLGVSGESIQRSDHYVTPLGLRTARYSASEVEYPAIRAMHAASSLSRPEDVRVWREGSHRFTSASERVAASTAPLPPPLTAADRTIEECIRQRGSARRFHRTPISITALATVLSAATRGFDADYRPAIDTGLVECLTIVHSVDGLTPGAYRYRPEQHALKLLRAGEFRDLAGHLALDQALGADAAVNVYFTADLPAVLDAFGNRGYRAAQLEGGIAGGRAYLAAESIGLGASGLTFYDAEVSRFFGSAAPGRSPMFLIAVGQRAPRRPPSAQGSFSSSSST